MSFTWSWIKMLLTGGFNEAAIRRGAEMLAVARGWKPSEFGDFVMFLYHLPADVLLQVEAFVGHKITFAAPSAVPGATDIAGSHDPDLPDCCNEFAPQIFLLKGAVMEDINDGELETSEPKEETSKSKKKKAS